MDKQDRASTLYISVYDSVTTSDVLVVNLIIARLTTTWTMPEKDGTVVSVAEYRQLLSDYTSTDERITERLQFLEAFCRNIIKPELQKHANTRHGTQ